MAASSGYSTAASVFRRRIRSNSFSCSSRYIFAEGTAKGSGIRRIDQQGHAAVFGAEVVGAVAPMPPQQSASGVAEHDKLREVVVQRAQPVV